MLVMNWSVKFHIVLNIELYLARASPRQVGLQGRQSLDKAWTECPLKAALQATMAVNIQEPRRGTIFDSVKSLKGQSHAHTVILSSLPSFGKYSHLY